MTPASATPIEFSDLLRSAVSEFQSIPTATSVKEAAEKLADRLGMRERFSEEIESLPKHLQKLFGEDELKALATEEFRRTIQIDITHGGTPG